MQGLTIYENAVLFLGALLILALGCLLVGGLPA